MARDWKLTGNDAWTQVSHIMAGDYSCGYCGFAVSSEAGLTTQYGQAFLRICPQCNAPTFFSVDGRQWPGRRQGASIGKLPKDVNVLYEEARSSFAVNAYSGVVLLCRKLLMHVAVEKGAAPDQSFVKYVEWLIKERYAPKGAETWVDYIRTRANELNHEIILMDSRDATALLALTEQLLRNVYELPSFVPPAKK